MELGLGKNVRSASDQFGCSDPTPSLELATALKAVPPASQAPLERREDLRELILRAAPVITRTMPRAVHFAAAPHFKARADLTGSR